MTQHIEGDLVVREAKIAVVASRFNDFITTKLVEGATDAFVRHGGRAEALTLVHVPGSFEVPIIALRLAKSGKYDAVVCLGCVIRGQTSHYDHVAGESAKGVAQVNMQTGVPTVLGIVTADTLEQAVDRAGGKHGNYGTRAMTTAIEMVNLMKKIS